MENIDKIKVDIAKKKEWVATHTGLTEEQAKQVSESMDTVDKAIADAEANFAGSDLEEFVYIRILNKLTNIVSSVFIVLNWPEEAGLITDEVASMHIAIGQAAQESENKANEIAREKSAKLSTFSNILFPTAPAE